MGKILVIEDDTEISNMLSDLLRQNGHLPTAAYSGTEAMLCFGLDIFDLVLLDLMLPGKPGDEVLSEIRQTSKVPVIVITAVFDKKTTASLLRSGADDYIAKPFDNDELLARIEVQLRRVHEQGSPNVLSYKDVILDTDLFDASVGGELVGLSKREYEILKLLISHPKKVFTKNNIYESVWNDEFFGDDNTINVHISKIRSKLGKFNPEEEYIQTVWGIGFKMY